MARLIEDEYHRIQTGFLEASSQKNVEGMNGYFLEAQELLSQSPEHPAILFLLGTMALNLGSIGLAVTAFTRAQQLNPDFSEVYNNLGAAWKQLHNNDKARHYLLKGLALRESPETLNNLCTLFVNNGNPQEGLDFAMRSIQLREELLQSGKLKPTPGFNPNSIQGNGEEAAQPIWNLSLLQLEMGSLEAGFNNYEAGLFSGDRWFKSYRDLPYWDGSPGKRLVLYDEQGLGDRILFMNLLRKLKDRNPIILDVHYRLYDLCRESFPWAETIYPNSKDAHEDWHDTVEADAVCAIGSLAKFFWKDYSDIDRTSYLTVPAKELLEVREALAQLGPPPYVGLAWRGGIHRTQSHDRSAKLGHLSQILVPGITYVSFQYTDDAEEKLARFNQTSPIPIHSLPFVTDPRSNYASTAALASCMEVCIVPNTALVHLCGAIGAFCWAFTPHKKAWRYYGPDPKHMAFYGNHVEILQQSPTEDGWSRIFLEIRSRLEALALRWNQ
jgi:tetratricopeptide (TPR) repeat protein